MNPTVKPRLTVEEYAEGILRSDRVVLSQAITLVESSLLTDQQRASALLEKIMNQTGHSVRIGITGVPGVGKSTFIEAFGKHLTACGKKIAVLTIDPSSQLTKGSILGDKTRMEELSRNPRVFIRPSAAGNTVGGVANRTREAILLCEAAGYEVIIVETVGVGQSEVAVKNMVDFFLLLMLAGAGDELQGIKKGIMEMADAIVVTKADADNIEHARKAQAEYKHALHFLPASVAGWNPPVLISSAITGSGMEDVWKTILRFEDETNPSGYFESNRQHQNVTWLHEYFNLLLRADLERFSNLQRELKSMEEQVTKKIISPYTAAHRLLQKYYHSIQTEL